MKGDKAICAYRNCETEFIQRDNRQVYCCTACKIKEYREQEADKDGRQRRHYKQREPRTYLERELTEIEKDNTGLIIVECMEGRRKMGIPEIAQMLKRPEKDIQRHYEEIKSNGRYEKILETIKQPAVWYGASIC